jgi:hypothetical protein
MAGIRRGATGARVAAMLAVLALGTGGCGSAVYIGTEGPDPAAAPMRCDRPADKPSGMLVLIAQAVPTASSVPCLVGPVPNWIMSRFDVRDGSGVVEFTHQFGAEDTATIDVSAGCDVSGAQEVSSRHNGMQRFNRDARRSGRYANEVYFVYPGGCTSLRFNLTSDGAELRGAEMAGELSFVTREYLDRQIRKASDDNLELDPDED